MLKAIVYVRVSDSRQIENTSLDGQEKVCRQWCQTNNLDVSRVFIERGESAKSADRPQFQAMFGHLSQVAKGSVSHVVCYKFDRFSRNVDDGAEYRLKLRKLGIALRSATEATDDSAAGKLFTTMLSAFGQFDNDTRAERTLTGMKNRLDSGRWQWPAPTGYITGDKNGVSLLPDPVRAPLVTRLFELVATGEHTKATALAIVTALGLRSRSGAPLTQETIRKILINPLYTGEIFIKGWGKSVRGDFAPLVSQTTFDRVQIVLAGRAHSPAPHVRDRVEFPLRGLMLCPDCEKPVTASLSTGKLGSKFGYYRCHRVSGHINVKAETVENAFIDLLERLSPKPERMELIERIFRNAWTDKVQTAIVDSAALRKELAKLEARKQRVLSQMADGILNEEDFAALHKSTGESIADVRTRLRHSEGDELDLDTALGYLQHLLWNTSYIWQTSDLQGKQRIQRRVFPKGLVWERTGFGTPLTHSIFTLLVSDSLSDVELVAPQGF